MADTSRLSLAGPRAERFRRQYGVRAGIEGTISQGVRAFGLRRARYFGQAKTRLQHILTAAAINLVRLAAWFAGDIPLPLEPHRWLQSSIWFHLIEFASSITFESEPDIGKLTASFRQACVLCDLR